MSPQAVAVVLAIVLVLGAATVWLSTTAGRLDRLHIRLATAQVSLERQLVERAAATADLAHSGVLDPAAAVLLLSAADGARDAARKAGDRADRDRAESALSADLRAVLGEPATVEEAWRAEAARPLLADLADACDRVRLARHFHDDLAKRTLATRRRAVVRWAHLAGHAPLPVLADLDDDPPPALLDRAHGWKATARRIS